MVLMKYFLQEGSRGNFLSGFKSENENLQLIPPLTSLPKSKVLKARVRLFPDYLETLAIAFSFYILFVYGSLSVYPFLIFFYYFFERPSNVVVMPGKVTINRPMRKPVVILIEDIMQISGKKNSNYSLRWIFRLIYIGLLLYDLINYWSIRDFDYLVQALLPLLFLAFISEFWVPYKCDLKIITSRSVLRLWPFSNLKLRIYVYTKKQEGLIRILKEEIK